MLGRKAISKDIASEGDSMLVRPETASVNRENADADYHATSAFAFSLGALLGNPSDVAGDFLEPVSNETLTWHMVFNRYRCLSFKV